MLRHAASVMPVKLVLCALLAAASMAGAVAAAETGQSPRKGDRFSYSILTETRVSDNKGYITNFGGTSAASVKVRRWDGEAGGRLLAEIAKPDQSFELLFGNGEVSIKGVPAGNFQKIMAEVLSDLEPHNMQVGSAWNRKETIKLEGDTNVELSATYILEELFSIGAIRCAQFSGKVEARGGSTADFYRSANANAASRITVAYETGEVIHAQWAVTAGLENREGYAIEVKQRMEMRSTSKVFQPWLDKMPKRPLLGMAEVPAVKLANAAQTGLMGLLCCMGMVSLAGVGGCLAARRTSRVGRLCRNATIICCIAGMLMLGMPTTATAAGTGGPILMSTLELATGTGVMAADAAAGMAGPVSPVLMAGASLPSLKSAFEVTRALQPPLKTVGEPSPEGGSAAYVLGGVAVVGGVAYLLSRDSNNDDDDQYAASEDEAGGSETLTDVVVDSRNIAITLYDHGRIDRDTISLWINDVPILIGFVLPAPPGATYNVVLNKGENTLKLRPVNLGAGPPNTTTLIISNVTQGKAEQRLRLTMDKMLSMTIGAP